MITGPNTSSNKETTEITIPWQGFDHIALITPNLDATISFYRDALGMQVGEVYEAFGKKTRHCFIKPGETRAQGLHFWEMKHAQLPPPPDSWDWQISGTITNAFSHIAFHLPNETAGLALRKRLEQHNVRFGKINELGSLHTFVFYDNNGIFLEAIWPTV